MLNISEDFFNYVRENINRDTTRLILENSFGDQELQNFAVTQIEVRKKSLEKFSPLIEEADNFIFPDKSVAEQSTNASVALYNASLIPEGSNVADLTAGLGIDIIAFSRRASKVIGVERDKLRAEILEFNLRELSIKNVEIINEDAAVWLQSEETTFDVIYLDPARRDAEDNRKTGIKDYSPNLFEILPLLKLKCKRLIVKLSPLLDITEAARMFPELSEIHVVDFKNECKELLLIFDWEKKERDNNGNITLKCVEIGKEGTYSVFDCKLNQDDTSSILPVIQADEINPGDMILQPSPAVIKVGKYAFMGSAFNGIGRLFNNSNLYYSKKPVEDFPGRRFNISSVLTGKELNKLKGENINVIARNFPLSSSEISSKYQFKEDGNRYLFAFKSGKKSIFLLTEKENG